MKSNRNLRKFAAVLVVAVMALLAIGSAPAAQAGNENPGVIPPQAHPFGHTYGEWANTYWQWTFAVPIHDEYGNILNPAFDETGERCGVAQSGKVWFLTETVTAVGGPPVTIERNCTVPHGKAIFFPVLGLQWDNAQQGNTQFDLQELRDQLEAQVGPLGGCPNCSVKVDGRSLAGIFGDADRIGYGNVPFTTYVPDDNMYEYFGVPVPAGTVYPTISDGWYVMLAPLSAGQHTVHIHTAIPDLIDWDVTYNLTVGH